MSSMSRRKPAPIKPTSVKDTMKEVEPAPQTKHLSMRIDPELHRRLHIQARIEDRTVSALIVELIKNYLDKNRN
jgi:hypothetical protein